MSPLLKPFAEASLKVVAGATSDNGDFSLQFPVWNREARSPAATSPLARAATSPLEQLMKRRPAPLADTHGWHHAGINE
jgi:hypothetical protein